MGVEPISNWHAATASALEWWADAGVDTLADDAPHDWLARRTPAPVAGAGPVAAAPAAAPEALPDTLEAFVAWRLGEAAPEAGWLSPRIAPTGPADAALMIVTDMPEPDDGAEAMLLGGAPGRLLDRMLAAIGHERAGVYIASLAVARPLSGQIDAAAMPRLAELLRHHIGLVAPQTLLLLGQTAHNALLDDPGATGLLSVNHIHGTCRAVACRHPRFLIERPAAKAEAWKALQLLLTRGN